MTETDEAQWSQVLGCPNCGGRVEGTTEELVCAGCAKRYPTLGGVLCLVPDPGLYRELWLSRLEDYLEVTTSRLHGLRQELRLPHLLPRTRARLERIIEAKSLERQVLPSLLSELRGGIEPLPSSGAPSRPESSQGRLAVLEWYEHVFRDWSWGAKENALLSELVRRLLPRRVDSLAVYGAGAGRLAFDIHRALAPARTLAIDLNPLPLLIAERLVRGGSVQLYEFPVAPTTDANMAVLQQLSAPAALDSRFRFAFADALSPPFPPGSVDAIVTPWFVDAIGIDLRITAAAINRTLKRGGLWLQLGPLNFNQDLSQTYLQEELLELVQASGFEVLQHFQERVPYFDSPVSGSWREETIYCFAAEKRAEVTPVERAAVVPPWVADPRRAIPPAPELMNLGRTSAFTAMVLSMIDGTRSIADISAAVSAGVGMDSAALELELRAFFAKLPVS